MVRYGWQKNRAERKIKTMASDSIKTADGKTVGLGDRVFNYYDRKWGVIATMPGQYDDGWFDLKQDDGTTALLNGERIAKDLPRNCR